MNGQNKEAENELVSALIDQLHDNGKLRVWSIIVTVFGDAIMPRGGVVSLSSLQEILGLLNIESNAVRTAMSRLAGDGWVRREKVGRQSFYSLTQAGLGLFESASQRIYASGPQSWDETFELVLRSEESHKTRAQFRREMRQRGFGSPIADLYLRPGSKGKPGTRPDRYLAVMEARNLVSGSIQGFVSLAWPMDDLNAEYAGLIVKFTPVLGALKRGDIFSASQCLIIRTLLIHDWRRLVLKDVDLPVHFKPDDWKGEDARMLVMNLYRELVVGSEAFLDACMASPENRLPSPNKEFGQRFS